MHLRDIGEPGSRGVGETGGVSGDVRGAEGGVQKGVGQGRRLGRAPVGLTAEGHGIEKSEHRVDPTLPKVPLPHATAVLQIHTELLPLHAAGNREVRRDEGRVHGRPQGAPLPPVRQGRIRPRKMRKI